MVKLTETDKAALKKLEQERFALDDKISDFKAKLRKRENQRKFLLGGLVVKAGLAELPDAVLLGALMFIKSKLPELEIQFASLGDKKFTDDQALKEVEEAKRKAEAETRRKTKAQARVRVRVSWPKNPGENILTQMKTLVLNRELKNPTEGSMSVNYIAEVRTENLPDLKALPGVTVAEIKVVQPAAGGEIEVKVRFPNLAPGEKPTLDSLAAMKATGSAWTWDPASLNWFGRVPAENLETLKAIAGVTVETSTS